MMNRLNQMKMKILSLSKIFIFFVILFFLLTILYIFRNQEDEEENILDEVGERVDFDVFELENEIALAPEIAAENKSEKEDEDVEPSEPSQVENTIVREEEISEEISTTGKEEPSENVSIKEEKSEQETDVNQDASVDETEDTTGNSGETDESPSIDNLKGSPRVGLRRSKRK